MKQAYCVCGNAIHQVFGDSKKIEVFCANCGKMVITLFLNNGVRLV